MNPNFLWIVPMYRFTRECSHLGMSDGARQKLERMAADLVGTSSLAAIYIPEGTEDVYQHGGKRGRVVGGVRMNPMPRGRRVEDYYYDDWDGSRRWPIGWPCTAVFAPEPSECPSLREHVEHLFGPGSFQGYVSRFQMGPFLLEPQMRDRLNKDFLRFGAIP